MMRLACLGAIGNETWTLALALLTAITSAIVGTYLMLDRRAMLTEGLSHAVLPGIVIGFAITGSPHSPWLFAAAIASGWVMVWSTERLIRRFRVDHDVALGMVFTFMLAVGVLVASRYLRDTTFHPDCIIDGNLTLAAVDGWPMPGGNWLPKRLVSLSLVLALTVAFLVTLRKEVPLIWLDPTLARRLGYRVDLIKTLWLLLVCLVTVVCFETAGSVLIVALMIAPPVAAKLIVGRMSHLILFSLGFAVVSAWLGFQFGMAIDVAPTGPMSMVAGGIAVAATVLGPRRGLVSRMRNRTNVRRRHFTAILQTAALKLPPGLGIAERQIRLAAELDWPLSRVRRLWPNVDADSQ